MRELAPAITVVSCYIALLFVLAVWVERRATRGKNAADNALVYSLAQGVYCTTWTYYGSVGFSVSMGLLFLTVYLGPTLALAFSGSVLRKLVRIKESHHITSIADFISARYGKSQSLGMLATVMVVVGLVPYLSLQLKTMIGTVAVITGRPSAYPASGRMIGPLMVLLMVVFTICFGIRRLRPTERHPGMMVALVAECVVKLVAFLAVGIFVTYFLFNGFGDLLGRAGSLPTAPALAGRGVAPPLSAWLSHLLVSASAIYFLPRQFHVAVVENSSEEHIRTSQWLLPVYLLAICVFTLPIAIAGIASGLPPAGGDTFVLALPVATGPRWLSWLVYLGGFSAGAGMLMIETVTIATMISNHLLMPVVDRIEWLGFLRRHIRSFRSVTAAAIIGAAFLYERYIGWRQELVAIGLLSFAAVFQLAPAILAGLYWKGASKAGALLGLGAGFAVWVYTLMLPIMAQQGLFPSSPVDRGPLGLTLLRPQALFGVGGLDPITHTVLWSMAFNAGLVVIGSLLWPPSATEAREAAQMVHVLSPERAPYIGARRPALIDVAGKREQAERLLGTYFGEMAAARMAGAALEATGVTPEGKMSILQLAQLEAEVERALASAIGAAAAHVAVTRSSLVDAEGASELSRAYAEILAELKVSPSELRRKVDYHRERERLLVQEAEMLRAFLNASRLLASSLEYGTTARTVAAIPVPWLVPAALLYVAEPLPGTQPLHFILAHVDPEKERRANQVFASSAIELSALPHLHRAVRSRKPEVTAPDRPSLWPPAFAELDFTSSLTLPLLARYATLGTLTLFDAETRRFRYPDDLALAQELAYRCASALDKARLFRRAQEAVRARDEFLAVASHELKTPLTPLGLQVQCLHRLLARGDLAAVPKARLEELLARSEAQIVRVSKLVDSLLDVSRITRGRLRLALEEADLSEIAVQVADILREEAAAARCPLVLEVGRRILGRWDRLRLEQVVTNLLANAIKYAPGKPIEIRTSVTDSEATLVIRDHGPGIGREDQERIFGPFERAVSYLEVSGFGLGLYIVRQIVEAHSGRITLHSQPGRGCTFTVELPLAPPPPRERVADGPSSTARG